MCTSSKESGIHNALTMDGFKVIDCALNIENSIKYYINFLNFTSYLLLTHNIIFY